jgi:hypothetical protein
VTAELRERLRYDTPFWAGGVTRTADGWRYPKAGEFQGVAKIVDKARMTVPLIASPWQLEFDQKMEEQRAAGLPMRAIVLKARQLGFSTWTEAKIGQRVTQLENQNAVIIAHEIKAASGIFNMLERMHSHLPSEEELGLGFSIKPDIVGKSFSENGRKHLIFGERSTRLRAMGRANTSIVSVDTAMSPESGRSETRNLVHMSEVAKWPERATGGTSSKMISVLNSVPYLPETLVVLEATANGLNHFYRRYMAAREGMADELSGETYAAIFVPWWRDPQYSMRFPSEEVRERFIASIGDGPEGNPQVGEDEPMLYETLGLTPEQLLWRRMQIRTQHEDNVDLFKQENPATDEEAFIGSGDPVFPGILVQRAIREAEAAPAPVLGTLRARGFETKKSGSGTVDIPTGAVWVPAADAHAHEPLLRVWEHPRTAESQLELPQAERKEPGQYVIGADFAEGAGNTITDGDFHGIVVWDHESKVQVAEHESRIDIDRVPLWLALVGLYFNEAWLLPERNSLGFYVVEALKELRYPKIYRPRQTGQTTERRTNKVGWETTQVTKPLIEGTMLEALRDGTHGVRSVKLARQMNTYVKDEKNPAKHGAQPGEHDDLLMAGMIGKHGAVELVPHTSKRRRPFRPEDPVTGY